MSELIDRNAVLAGKKYDVKPGLRYEVKAGIVVTLKDDTYELVEAFDNIGSNEGDEKKTYQVAKERAMLVTTAPDGFDWKEVSMQMLWRIVQDFLQLALPAVPKQSDL